MKKILSITTLLISLSVSAQGNLQFNQVVKPVLNFVSNTLWTPSVGTITVPTGKVWKIETVTYLGGNSGTWWPLVGLSDYVILEDFLVYDDDNNIKKLFPLWLPSGTYTIKANQGTTNQDKRIAISAIEFNVLP